MDRYSVLMAIVILALLLGSLAGAVWLQAAR
jgi:hypothetical protein